MECKFKQNCLLFRDVFVEQFSNHKSTLLRDTFLIVLVVNVGDTESRLIALGPLKVTRKGVSGMSQTNIQLDLLHQTPSHVLLHIDSVNRRSISHSTNIISIILSPKFIIEEIL